VLSYTLCGSNRVLDWPQVPSVCYLLSFVAFSLADPWRSVKPGLCSTSGGDEGTRTPDLCLAKAPLSHLSYIPPHVRVGLSRLERLTFRLSGECSNQLSYRPASADSPLTPAQ
jgi:hypothetical protein